MAGFLCTYITLMLLPVLLLYKSCPCLWNISPHPPLYSDPFEPNFFLPCLVHSAYSLHSSYESHLESPDLAEGHLNMPEQEPPIRDIDIRKPEESDIYGMISMFRVSFEHQYPRLWRLMYKEDPSVDRVHIALEDILNAHMNSWKCKFMVAYDEDNGYDTDESEGSRNLTYGWISLGVAPRASREYVCTTSDLRTYACLEVLDQARAVGAHVDTNDGRFRLLWELHSRSIRGQAANYFAYPYLVVNALVLWPESHEEVVWDMATKLLGWAVSTAERDGRPIWTQIPVYEKDFFLEAGFIETGTFTLNLNHYKPHGSTRDWGTQEWVQMLYRCRYAPYTGARFL